MIKTLYHGFCACRKVLSPTIHKFGDEFTHSGLSAVRHAHRPELIEGLSQHCKAFMWITYVTVFANRST
jgi:hypothetical protein